MQFSIFSNKLDVCIKIIVKRFCKNILLLIFLLFSLLLKLNNIFDDSASCASENIAKANTIHLVLQQNDLTTT